MIEHPVPYEYDGKAYEGMLVYDDSVSEKRPAIFMQPDWLGVCGHTTGMAAERKSLARRRSARPRTWRTSWTRLSS